MERSDIFILLFIILMTIIIWETIKILFKIAYYSIRIWLIEFQLEVLKKKEEEEDLNHIN